MTSVFHVASRSESATESSNRDTIEQETTVVPTHPSAVSTQLGYLIAKFEEFCLLITAFHCSESSLTSLERHTQQVVWFIALETKAFVLQRDVRCWIFQANYSPTFEKDSNCAFLVLTVDEYVSKRNEVEEEKKMVLYWLTWWIVIYILGIRQSIKSQVKQRGKFARLPRTTAVISKMRRVKMIRLNAKVLQERGRICQLHRCNFTCYSEHVSCRRIAFKD